MPNVNYNDCTWYIGTLNKHDRKRACAVFTRPWEKFENTTSDKMPATTVTMMWAITMIT